MINTVLSGFYGAVGSLMGKLAFSFELPYVTVFVNELCSNLLSSDACISKTMGQWRGLNPELLFY
jgi:hypothetical protein